MSKTILGVIAAVVVVSGVTGFVLTRPDAETSSSKTATSSRSEQTKTQSSDESKSGPLSEFLAAGDEKKCTYSDERGSGTMYFSKGRLRNDIQSSKDGKTSEGHMIVTEAVQYIWFDNQQSGLKFAFSKTDANPQAANQGGLDATATYSFRCSSWAGDESFFVPPSNITFTDLTQLRVPGM